MGRTRFAINGKFIMLLSIIGIITIAIFKIPPIIEYNNIKSIGYDEDSIDRFYEFDLEKTIIEENYFSQTLNDAIKDKSFDIKYYEIYKTKALLTDDEKNMIDRLLIKHYDFDNINNIFSGLTLREMYPLLVFDYQPNINLYIKDVTLNRTKNSDESFVLNDSYIKLYANVEEIKDPSALDVNVSKKYHLPSTYVPQDLHKVPVRFASPNVLLRKEAYDATIKMFEAMEPFNFRSYITNGYRSYDYQVELYDSYVTRDGVERADTYAARPGHSEHQTGLTFDITSLGYEMVDFSESEAYGWLTEHAHEYGFIQRYATNKTSITGYREESWHWRFVGVDLATKLKESKLTFDEYYEFYMKEIEEPVEE